MSDDVRESPSPARPADSDTGSSLRRLHLWQIQGVRDVILGAFILGVVYLGYALSSVTVPLLLGLLLAYLFEPLVQWLLDDGEAGFAEIFLDDVRVPCENRLGEENQGWSVAMATAWRW